MNQHKCGALDHHRGGWLTCRASSSREKEIRIPQSLRSRTRVWAPCRGWLLFIAPSCHSLRVISSNCSFPPTWHADKVKKETRKALSRPHSSAELNTQLSSSRDREMQHEIPSPGRKTIDCHTKCVEKCHFDWSKQSQNSIFVTSRTFASFNMHGMLALGSSPPFGLLCHCILHGRRFEMWFMSFMWLSHSWKSFNARRGWSSTEEKVFLLS